MERKDFEAWLDNISVAFLSLTDPQKNEALDTLIGLSGAVQLRHLSNNLETLLKRDFLRLLPLELSFYLLKWFEPQTLLTCCLVSKQWNKVISACTEVWQAACKNLGWQIDDAVQDALHWKKVYLKAILRMKQLKDHEAFETSSLIGHSARVYALFYKDGLLCTGKKEPWKVQRDNGSQLGAVSSNLTSAAWWKTSLSIQAPLCSCSFTSPQFPNSFPFPSPSRLQLRLISLCKEGCCRRRLGGC